MLEASRDVEELAYRVIGAAIEVHTLLGPGLLESSYEQAMIAGLELGLIFNFKVSLLGETGIRRVIRSVDDE